MSSTLATNIPTSFAPLNSTAAPHAHAASARFTPRSRATKSPILIDALVFGAGAKAVVTGDLGSLPRLLRRGDIDPAQWLENAAEKDAVMQMVAIVLWTIGQSDKLLHGHD